MALRHDFWRQRVKSAQTREDLTCLWVENMGETLKDDTEIIQIFKDRARELDKSTKSER